MARPTLDNVRNIGDVASAYRWDLTFLQVPTALASYSSEDMNVRCESTTLPKRIEATPDVNIRGHKVLFPGRLTYSNELDMTFIETENNMIAKFLKAWWDLLWDPKLGTRYPKNQLEARLLIKRLDHNNVAIWQYQIHGVFLKDADFGKLDGETETIKPTVKFSYDYFIEKEL